MCQYGCIFVSDFMIFIMRPLALFKQASCPCPCGQVLVVTPVPILSQEKGDIVNYLS